MQTVRTSRQWAHTASYSSISNLVLVAPYTYFTRTEHLTPRYMNMLWTIFIILLVLWALGLASGATLNGFIHILLVIAIVVVLLRVIQGRRIA